MSSHATLSFDPGAVIVAGGSGGIGAGIARRFAAAGVPVLITYRSSEPKAQTVRSGIENAGGRCEHLQIDLADPAQVDRLFAHAQTSMGRIAHVVYAAGPSFDFNFIGAIPPAEWHRVMNADVNGAFHLVQHAANLFKAQGGGNLAAVITSAVGRVPLRDIMSAAPKAAIEMLVKGVAKEYGRFGVRANCVGPGWINAGLGKQALEDKLDEKTRESIRKHTIPLQRFGKAEDIGWATLFLCSQQAGFITGQTLAVDGGAQL
jgi:NAD(P)-dependent dehydrogenase (short-subunit alcohol dehydrogenase family)